jgi:hypothetical protein
MREAIDVAKEICGCGHWGCRESNIRIIEADRKQARLEERAKIVARLRVWFIDTAANAIEAGEHLK